MNDIKEKEQLSIVPLVTQLLSRECGKTDGQGGDYMLPQNFSGSIKIVVTY
jgi:hypothetical protein